MAAIRGEVFLIIGTVVTVFSLLSPKLKAFVAIGVLFIVYGGIKVLFQLKTRKKKTSSQNPSHSLYQNQQQHQNQHHQQHPNHAQHQQPQQHTPHHHAAYNAQHNQHAVHYNTQHRGAQQTPPQPIHQAHNTIHHGSNTSHHTANHQTQHPTHTRSRELHPRSVVQGHKTCSKCGAQNTGTANFCTHCGNRI